MTTGWDASSSIVGVATIDDDGSLAWKDHIDLRKAESLWDKTQLVRDFIRRKTWAGMSVHVLEDRLGGFTRGMSSQQTLMRLAAFNALVAFVIQDELGTAPVMMHPSTAKSLLKKTGFEVDKESAVDKKVQKLAYIQLREPEWTTSFNRNGRLQPWCLDEADAYGLALSEWLRSRGR